jgi:two-component system response regulator AtoC
VQLIVNPLRERPEDVLPLAHHFLRVYSDELKKPVAGFSPEVAEVFARYSWPGNVRELRNTVERAMIFAETGRPIRLAHLPPQLRQEPRPRPTTPAGFRPLREMELSYIREVLDACGGNRTRAAEVLGLSPVTLWRRLGRDTGEEATTPPTV